MQILDGGEMTVSSGGEATSIKLLSNGSMRLEKGMANFTSIASGATQTIAAGGYGYMTQNIGGVQIIDGAYATDRMGTFASNAIQEIRSGAALNELFVSSAVQKISANAVASNTQLKAWGSQVIFSGGTAVHTVIDRGLQEMYGGSAVNTEIISGTQKASYGGYIHSTILNGGQQYVHGTDWQNTLTGETRVSKVFVYDTTINNGATQTIGWATEAVSTTVNSGGRQIVWGDTASGWEAIVSNTVVNDGGLTIVSNGGVVKDATIHSGGSLLLSSGAALQGDIMLSGGLLIAGIYLGHSSIDATEATITLDVTGRIPENKVQIGSIGNLVGANYCLTVSSEQESGTYWLASGANSFNDAITLFVDGTQCSELVVGKSLTWMGEDDSHLEFTLSVSDGILSLDVLHLNETRGAESDVASTVNAALGNAVVFKDETEVSLTLDEDGSLNLNVVNAVENTRHFSDTSFADAVMDYSNLVSFAEDATAPMASDLLTDYRPLEDLNKGLLA